MKILFSLLLTLGLTTSALAQGKVNFINDSLHLVYWDPQSGTAFAGQPYLLGQGGQVLTIELWAGTSSASLSLQSRTDFSGQSAAGKWVGKTVTFPTIPGGPIFAEVFIYDTAAGSWQVASTTAGYIFATSGEFMMNASSTIAYNSIVNHNSPANSTWADGTYNMDFLSPGFRGSFMLEIPEPSIFPLTGLALALVVLHRPRRKCANQNK